MMQSSMAQLKKQVLGRKLESPFRRRSIVSTRNHPRQIKPQLPRQAFWTKFTISAMKLSPRSARFIVDRRTLSPSNLNPLISEWNLQKVCRPFSFSIMSVQLLNFSHFRLFSVPFYLPPITFQSTTAERKIQQCVASGSTHLLLLVITV